MKQAEWYFDFISPFSYLQSTRLVGLARLAHWQARPILFGAILNHWGSIGPAELAPKRQCTYEHCLWIAHREQIPFRMPPEHPFNPLPLLRLALTRATEGVVPLDVVLRIFRFVWQDGHLPGSGRPWQELLAEFGVREEELGAPEIKEALRANGERALAARVFGVPATVSEGRLFWGFDSTDMLTAWLCDDPWFATPEWAALADLPIGIERRRS